MQSQIHFGYNMPRKEGLAKVLKAEANSSDESVLASAGEISPELIEPIRVPPELPLELWEMILFETDLKTLHLCKEISLGMYLLITDQLFQNNYYSPEKVLHTISKYMNDDSKMLSGLMRYIRTFRMQSVFRNLKQQNESGIILQPTEFICYALTTPNIPRLKINYDQITELNETSLLYRDKKMHLTAKKMLMVLSSLQFQETNRNALIVALKRVKQDAESISFINLSAMVMPSSDTLNYSHFNFENARFIYTRLAHASFVGAYLQGASFLGSNLEGTNFSKAMLRGVSLEGTSLLYTDFTGADLTQTKFGCSTGLRTSKLNKCQFFTNLNLRQSFPELEESLVFSLDNTTITPSNKSRPKLQKAVAKDLVRILMKLKKKNPDQLAEILKLRKLATTHSFFEPKRIGLFRRRPVCLKLLSKLKKDLKAESSELMVQTATDSTENYRLF